MIASLPLRVRCGIGLPHLLQNAVAKLRAWGRSKRMTDGSPRSHRSAEAFTITSQECAVPVAFRHREQWQLRKRSNGPSTSNATSPQRQLPRNAAILVSSPDTSPERSARSRQRQLRSADGALEQNLTAEADELRRPAAGLGGALAGLLDEALLIDEAPEILLVEFAAGQGFDGALQLEE